MPGNRGEHAGDLSEGDPGGCPQRHRAEWLPTAGSDRLLRPADQLAERAETNRRNGAPLGEATAKRQPDDGTRDDDPDR
jgi:hypothetical protein